MHFTHVTIKVSDLERSVLFYKEVLGLKVIRELDGKGGGIVFMAGDDKANTFVELLTKSDQERYQVTGISLGFVSEDIDKDHQRITTMGLNPSAIHRPNSFTAFFFIQDPDGVKIQFIQED